MANINVGMNIQTVNVKKMKPAAYNPRKDLKPGDPAYEKIKRSLTEFGYVDPIIWNEVTGNIVGGHQRYKVLTEEGATELQCVVVHIEKPEDEKALNIVLNKAVGEWEPVALADLLQDLQSADYDLGSTGFEPAEIDDLFSKVKEEDLSALMGDVKANLVVSDPPYNVNYESSDGKTIQNDSMGNDEFYEFLLSAFKNWAAHLVKGASAYVFHADTEGVNFRRAFVDAGFHLSGVCVWVKNSMVLGRSPYQWQHEPVLYGWLPNGNHKWFSDRKQTTVWNFDRPATSKLHPTMKPIQLVAYPIKNSTAPNAVVLDTFGGSGSTMIACEETDRICYTMEIDPKYATAIVERFRLHTGNTDRIKCLRDGQEMTYDEATRA